MPVGRGLPKAALVRVPWAPAGLSSILNLWKVTTGQRPYDKLIRLADGIRVDASRKGRLPPRPRGKGRAQGSLQS